MILGAVLAGGQSSRFGSDKAAALLRGRPMIEHVIATLTSYVDQVVICGRDHDALPGLTDRPAPGFGPLGGINAALHHAAAHGYAIVVTVPCDTPTLGGDVIAMLAATAEPTILAGCPVIGAWPVVLATELDHFLATASNHSMRAWARAADARELAESHPANVNLVADLARLQD